VIPSFNPLAATQSGTFTLINLNPPSVIQGTITLTAIN
jgi:hypothetical protein